MHCLFYRLWIQQKAKRSPGQVKRTSIQNSAAAAKMAGKDYPGSVLWESKFPSLAINAKIKKTLYLISGLLFSQSLANGSACRCQGTTIHDPAHSVAVGYVCCWGSRVWLTAPRATPNGSPAHSNQAKHPCNALWSRDCVWCTNHIFNPNCKNRIILRYMQHCACKTNVYTSV